MNLQNENEVDFSAATTQEDMQSKLVTQLNSNLDDILLYTDLFFKYQLSVKTLMQELEIKKLSEKIVDQMKQLGPKANEESVSQSVNYLRKRSDSIIQGSFGRASGHEVDMLQRGSTKWPALNSQR